MRVKDKVSAIHGLKREFANVCFCMIVPSEVIIDLVQERLSKSDCKLNGWILDGCPFSHDQVKMLKEEKIEPQKVIAFETPDEIVAQEISKSKIDPQTGKQFTPEELEVLDESLRKQLVSRDPTQVN